VALEQRLWAEVGRHLAAAVAARVPARRGFRTVDAYVRERLGLSPRKTRALLRLERAGDFCPPLRAAYRDGRLSWVQAQVLLPLLWLEASAPYRASWIEFAERVSVRRLEDDVDRALALEEFEPPSLTAQRQTCAQPTLSERDTHPVADGEEGARFFFAAPRDVARLIRATICSVRRGLEPARGRPTSEGEAVEAMLDHALATWRTVDKHEARAQRVYARDGWRCTAPGCSSFRNLHDHHIVFRSHCGGDELTNRTTLCAWHHQRGVHAYRMRCTGLAPDALLFELGVRPDGSALLRFRSGDVRVA